MSGRSGQSQSTLRAVEGRRAEIRKVEQGVQEILAQMRKLNEVILIQEDAVGTIAQQSDVVHENVTQGNTQLDGAITKARAANRKKWYCLGIASKFLCKKWIVVPLLTRVSSHHSCYCHHCSGCRGGFEKQMSVAILVSLSAFVPKMA